MGKEIQVGKSSQITTISKDEHVKKVMAAIQVTASTPPSEILSKGLQQLSEFGRLPDGRMYGAALFKDVIISIVEFYGETWSDPMILQAATIAYNEAYWFTLAELKQFALKVKGGSGEYSSNKNLKPPILLQFLDTYMTERLTERAGKFDERKRATTTTEEPTEDEERYQKQLDELKEKAKAIQDAFKAESEKEHFQSLNDKHRHNQYEAIKKVIDAGHTLDAQTKARYEQLKKHLNK